LAIAAAIMRIYPHRHTIYRALFFSKSLVPERNDYYQLSNIWTEQQVTELLNMVKEKGIYEPASRD
jgi:hypothetical protein